VIISRTLVYAVLVAVLAALYLGGVTLVGGLVRTVAGGSGAIGVTVSTLLVAVAFQPLRTRIQRGVDRRFYRGRYDAARTLESFSGRLREHVEIATVSGEVLDVVHETLQPAHVSSWLRSPGPSDEGRSRRLRSVALLRGPRPPGMLTAAGMPSSPMAAAV
jgi:hypothetical protein